MDLREIGLKGVDLIHLTLDRHRLRPVVNSNRTSGSISAGNSISSADKVYQLSKGSLIDFALQRQFH
jgi:hypothetical protein